MKRLALAAAFVLAAAAPPAAAQTVGLPAPDFSAPDLQGKPVKLSDFKGKYVVLEWVNPSARTSAGTTTPATCPSCRRSSRPRAWSGSRSAPRASRAASSRRPSRWRNGLPRRASAPRAALIDKGGKVGRLYGARTTPRMYVVDPQGKLIYAGAIDDKRWASADEAKNARNHVRAAPPASGAGEPVRRRGAVAVGRAGGGGGRPPP